MNIQNSIGWFKNNLLQLQDNGGEAEGAQSLAVCKHLHLRIENLPPRNQRLYSAKYLIQVVASHRDVYICNIYKHNPYVYI